MAPSDVTVVLQRLDHTFTSHRGAAPVIASDGDGTLWAGDIGESLFMAALRDEVLLEDVVPALRAEAQQFSLSEVGDAHALARTLLHAFERRNYPEVRAFAMMTWVFAGWSVKRMTGYCDSVLDDFGFGAAVRPEMAAVVAWAAQKELPVWVVSASPQHVVQRAVVRMGLDPANVIAMEPELVDDVLQPRLASAPTYGQGKLERLRLATDQPLLAAFGDSGFDAALLEGASLPVAVAPRAKLRDAVAQWPHALIIADGKKASP